MPDLHEYQELAVERALATPGRRWLFNDEMGLGKTAEAIECLKRLETKEALIVCPAIVRPAWVRELDLWWPEHPEIGVVHAGTTNNLSKAKAEVLRQAFEAPIQIVSYNLLHKITRTFDTLVADECHRVKEPSTNWYREIRKLSEDYRRTVFGLTATAMPNSPLDFCGIAEVICPGRFGGVHPHYGLSKKCKDRYSNYSHNGYGPQWTGINEQYADELQYRIGQMSSRTTKLDVLHLLPAFDVRIETIDASLPDLDNPSGTLNLKDLDDLLALAGQAKLDYVKEWVDNNSASHICIMTYHRALTKQVAHRLKKSGKPIYRLDGGITPEKRNELLAEAKGRDSAILVCTMSSVGIGIDLTFCTSALFVEMCYRLETVLQALGRFSRLSGKVPSNVLFLVVRNTIDEIIANRLLDKLVALNKAAKAGLSEQELTNTLGSEEDFLELVEQTLSTTLEDDEYECDWDD